MSYEERQNHYSGQNRFRSTLNIGMGIVYLLMGCLVVYMKVFGVVPLEPVLAYVLGGLMIVYGIFRLWRGIMDIRKSKIDQVRRDLDKFSKH